MTIMPQPSLLEGLHRIYRSYDEGVAWERYLSTNYACIVQKLSEMQAVAREFYGSPADLTYKVEKLNVLNGCGTVTCTMTAPTRTRDRLVEKYFHIHFDAEGAALTYDANILGELKPDDDPTKFLLLMNWVFRDFFVHEVEVRPRHSAAR